MDLADAAGSDDACPYSYCKYCGAESEAAAVLES